MRRSRVWGPSVGIMMWLAAPLAGRAAELCRVEPGYVDSFRLTNLSSGAAPSEVLFGDAGVQRVAVAPDRDVAYVAIGNRFSVVDMTTLQVIDHFRLPIPVMQMIVGPDGRLHTIEFDGSGAWVRSIDPQTHVPARAIALPDGTYEVRGLSLAGDGRWLFAQAYDGTSQVVSVIDLTDRTVVASHPVPAAWYMSSELVASPTGDFAYLVEAEEIGVREGALWMIPVSGEPRKLDIALTTGGVTFAPDGTRAYIALQLVVDGDDPTVVVDTATHTKIGELPSGAIAGFESADCLILSGARVPRRACVGDASSQPLADGELSPRRVEPNLRDGIAPTLWTQGPCSAPARPCPETGACLEIVGASGSPGETVSLRARLHSRGAAVSAVQADVYADLALPIGLAGPNHDDPGLHCTVNPAIDKPQSVWSCLEPGSGGCLSVRSLVLSFFDLSVIDDGADLYSCEVPIPADAAFGSYRVTCGNSGASDPDGTALPMVCEDGAIQVVPNGTGNQPQASGGAQGGGCQVAARPSTSATVLLLLIPLLARRRSRRLAAAATRRGAGDSHCGSSRLRRAGR